MPDTGQTAQQLYNIIDIYGEIDPWTAGAVESIGQTNSVKIIQPGANPSILIENLDQKGLVHSTLEDWLDLTIRENGTSLHKNCEHREEIFPARKWITEKSGI